MKQVKIYTDGACSGNPGPGGWGAVLIYEGKEKEISGHEKSTTNNRMELTAAIRALESLKEKCAVELHTDSTYLKKGMTEWMKGWKANSWKGSNKKTIKNIELWHKLDELDKYHCISWKWVKAHNGDHYNERADKLATNACKKSKE